MEPYNYEKHWNNVYVKSEITKLGWYQGEASPSLKIIKELEINDEESVLVVGAGLTTLAEDLIALGYHNLIFSDISESSMKKLEERLKPHDLDFSYFVDDLANPLELNKLNNIGLWHDRAVLHFLNKEPQKEEYVKLMHKVIKGGGYAIIAAFALDGAPKCSGLDVHRYSRNMLDDLVGDEFELVDSFDYTYIQPSGNERPYVYTVFKRNAH